MISQFVLILAEQKPIKTLTFHIKSSNFFHIYLEGTLINTFLAHYMVLRAVFTALFEQ